MSQSHDVFQSRVNVLTNKHRAMANGYTASIRHDGLIIVEPKPRKRGIPLRIVVFLVLGFILFKTAMLIMMGDAVYAERVALLANGTAVESVAAWMMQVDPLTALIADTVRAMLP
jgi:hypothetical protein